uniref:Pyruvate phosphate dikinase AMP/ATP-binding domain-containing protein n=1 Tax=Strigamia maritima TaxID=126957 RepID=T1J0M4_STRMM
MKQTVLSTEIKQSILKEMENAFGVHYKSMKLAVRSSAIGEDGEELSSAGQNETYLGISGFQNICEAVVNCWASQFTYIAAVYKRQYGQLLNPGMAVVIQEMIPAEVAGVIFTHDPTTGNPGHIIITANYGLGETVVSASAEPDTFIMNRSFDGKLSGKEKILGSKSVQIVQNKNGTETISVKSEKSDKLCLSDEQCLELGLMGILVELSFGSARDIEWCITHGQIYFLQARPITSLDPSSDFEIMHEFDSPIKTELEHCTKANT